MRPIPSRQEFGLVLIPAAAARLKSALGCPHACIQQKYCLYVWPAEGFKRHGGSICTVKIPASKLTTAIKGIESINPTIGFSHQLQQVGQGVCLHSLATQ